MSGLAERYAAGTQALRDKLDADLAASEARAQDQADRWAERRHSFVADPLFPGLCARCWHRHGAV